jgi:hypothetical protein
MMWFSRLGLGLIAYFAADEGGGASSAASVPRAQPYQPPYGEGCCGVYFPNGPYCPYTNTMSDYNCSPYPGTNKQYWVCGSGSRAMGCGECTMGDSCYHSGWKCSTWWKINP